MTTSIRKCKMQVRTIKLIVGVHIYQTQTKQKQQQQQQQRQHNQYIYMKFDITTNA